jgi:hypothetical protein
VESLLTQELNQMSLQERELAYEEVHCVDKMIDEPTKFVTERLEALERELRMIPIKPAYGQATAKPNKSRSFMLPIRNSVSSSYARNILMPEKQLVAW